MLRAPRLGALLARGLLGSLKLSSGASGVVRRWWRQHAAMPCLKALKSLLAIKAMMLDALSFPLSLVRLLERGLSHSGLAPVARLAGRKPIGH